MVIGTGTANATRSRQTFGGNSPAVPGLNSPVTPPAPKGNLAVPFGGSSQAPTPLQRSGGGLAQGAPIWYPDYNSQQHDLLSSDDIRISGEDFDPFLLTPGYGSTAKSKGLDMGFHPCGFVKFMIVCPEDIRHYKEFARKSCFRPACPVCWPIWAAREANRAAERIQGHKEAFKRYNNARHISFSPPPRTIKSLDDLLNKARDVMKIAGVEAAAAIPHPYRLLHNELEQIPDRSWTNRYVEVLGKATWRDFVRYSPHVHAIVSGPLMDSKEFHDKTGWVYRNHDQYAHKRSLRGTLYYLLTHAWVNGNNKAIRYWFGMNNHMLGRVELEPEYKTTPCPKCKTDCVKVDVVQDLLTDELRPAREDLHNCEVVKRKVRRWEYIARVGKE